MRNFRKNSVQRRDHYQELTDKIVAALEAGIAPWRRPWTRMPAANRRPRSTPLVPEFPSTTKQARLFAYLIRISKPDDLGAPPKTAGAFTSPPYRGSPTRLFFVFRNDKNM
jgi:hypothetical protein